MGFLPLGARPAAVVVGKAKIPASCELYHYCRHNGFQIDLECRASFIFYWASSRQLSHYRVVQIITILLTVHWNNILSSNSNILSNYNNTQLSNYNNTNSAPGDQKCNQNAKLIVILHTFVVIT